MLTIPLAIAHWFYAGWLSMILYQASGGIQKLPSGWTEFGGAKLAWTIPLELPGTLITRFGQYLRGDRPNWHTPNTFDQLDESLVLGASLLTYAIASLVVALIIRRQPVFGRFYWRLILILLGLLWIPVPEHLAEVWQYTFVY